MRIVVTTPTGHIGSRAATLLVQAGVRPTLLARDAARVDRALRDSCDVVELDLGDAEAVVAATSGADALLWVCPRTDDDDPVAGYARLGAVGARAVRENGIDRVVLVSSVGAEARHGFGEIDGLGRAEELLDAAARSVLHLRCGYFFTNLLLDVDSLRAGVLTTTLPVGHRFPWVDPRDIGEVAAARLLSTAWSGRHTQGVHGPADLGFADVARVLSEVTDRPIEARQVTDEDVARELTSLGLSPAQVEGFVGMARGIRGPFTPQDPRTAVTTTPTTLASWAQEHLRPALAP